MFTETLISSSVTRDTNKKNCCAKIIVQFDNDHKCFEITKLWTRFDVIIWQISSVQAGEVHYVLTKLSGERNSHISISV